MLSAAIFTLVFFAALNSARLFAETGHRGWHSALRHSRTTIASRTTLFLDFRGVLERYRSAGRQPNPAAPLVMSTAGRVRAGQCADQQPAGEHRARMPAGQVGDINGQRLTFVWLAEPTRVLMLKETSRGTILSIAQFLAATRREDRSHGMRGGQDIAPFCVPRRRYGAPHRFRRGIRRPRPRDSGITTGHNLDPRALHARIEIANPAAGSGVRIDGEAQPSKHSRAPRSRASGSTSTTLCAAQTVRDVVDVGRDGNVTQDEGQDIY